MSKFTGEEIPSPATQLCRAVSGPCWWQSKNVWTPYLVKSFLSFPNWLPQIISVGVGLKMHGHDTKRQSNLTATIVYDPDFFFFFKMNSCNIHIHLTSPTTTRCAFHWQNPCLFFVRSSTAWCLRGVLASQPGGLDWQTHFMGLIVHQNGSGGIGNNMDASIRVFSAWVSFYSSDGLNKNLHHESLGYKFNVVSIPKSRDAM